MNKKININPSSTKWLEKDDRVVADYFCDLGFRSLKQILDMRVFDLMNMQGLNAVRVEEVIICLYILQLPKNYDTISIDFGIDKNEMKRLVIALAELDLTIDEWLCFKMKELILADRLSKENRGEE